MAAGSLSWSISLLVAAVVAGVLIRARRGCESSDESACVRVVANGGAATDVLCTISLEKDEHWRRTLRRSLPHARTIELWSDGGELLLRASTTDAVGSPPEALARALAVARATGGVLYSVTDGFPFVWPQAAAGAKRSLTLADGRTVELETVSSKPRVLVADGVLDEAECDAIRRLAEPGLEADVTLVTGDGIEASLQETSRRTSKSALLTTPTAAAAGTDGAVLRSVRERIASLVRQHALVAERMQVVRYRPGQHYHYHMDTGQDSPWTVRFATALIYLNGGYGGGETNFPVTEETRSAGPLGRLRDRLLPLTRNEKFIRMDYNNCQTARGLTLSARPGRVALFYNTLPSSFDPDFYAWHGGCDVSEGEKWVANLWYNFGNLRNLTAALAAEG